MMRYWLATSEQLDLIDINVEFYYQIKNLMLESPHTVQ